MVSGKLYSEIVSELVKARESDRKHISVETLESILLELEETRDHSGQAEPNELQHTQAQKMEAWKAEVERTNMVWRAEIERENNWTHAQVETMMESFRSTIAYSQAALRSAVLINGGGAVALLAFIGNALSTSSFPHLLPGLAKSLWWYVMGVLVASVAIGASYMAQVEFTHAQPVGRSKTKESKRGRVFQFFAIVLIVISYISFAIASRGAYLSFHNPINQIGELEMTPDDPARPNQPPITPDSEPTRGTPSPVPTTAPPKPVQPPPPVKPPDE